jgi:prepilin-type N-terminal cleavage/methylation domain-containing protein
MSRTPALHRSRDLDRSRNPRGFTLLELLVAMFLSTLAVGMVMYLYLSYARQQAVDVRKMNCQRELTAWGGRWERMVAQGQGLLRWDGVAGRLEFLDRGGNARMLFWDETHLRLDQRELFAACSLTAVRVVLAGPTLAKETPDRFSRLQLRLRELDRDRDQHLTAEELDADGSWSLDRKELCAASEISAQWTTRLGTQQTRQALRIPCAVERPNVSLGAGGW